MGWDGVCVWGAGTGGGGGLQWVGASGVCGVRGARLKERSRPFLAACLGSPAALPRLQGPSVACPPHTPTSGLVG
jgi:hypothetical protein